MEDNEKAALQKLTVYMENQKKELEANPKDLQAAFIAQPNGFLQAALRFDKATRIWDTQKKVLDKLEATKYMAIKNSGEKTTEEYIKKAITLDPDVERQRDITAAAEYQVSCYKSLMRAWEHRRDMLIQLGSSWRAEFNAGVQVNRDHGTADADTTYRSPRAAKFAPGLE